MRTLYHFPLCPFSRKVRITLKEKGLVFELVEEQFWQRNNEFQKLNPAGQVPVLINLNDQALADSNAICEYIDEKHPDRPLIGQTPEERAQTRQLCGWFDSKFFFEVTRHLVNQKVIRFYAEDAPPDSKYIREAKHALPEHLNFISRRTKEHQWLAGDTFTLADIAAASQISVVDFLGEVDWNQFPRAKAWYALVKSRPSFRSLLSDYIIGFTPPKHYANPDF